MSGRSLVERIGEGFFQIRVPLPFPLRWVNAYALRDPGGFTLIDPGLRTEQAMRCWEEALRTIGCADKDIVQIVLTHHHPDHIGMAGTLQQASGAPVYLSEAGIEQAVYLWGPQREATREVAELFVRHGMDADTERDMLAHMESFLPQVSPLPAMTPIAEGARIAAGGRTWRTIHAPGHAYGQLMLLDEAGGDLICGDHVLPQITPNVSLLPRFDPDPLASYLQSLSAVSALPVKRVFPGHREPFEGFAERCAAIARHHDERLSVMLGKLGEPATGFELCRLLFGRSLSIHQLRFALAETLAHLVYLRERGQLREEAGAADGRDIVRFARV